MLEAAADAGKEAAALIGAAAADLPPGTVLVVVHSGGGRAKALAGHLRDSARGTNSLATSLWLRDADNVVRINDLEDEDHIRDVTVFRLAPDGRLQSASKVDEGRFADGLKIDRRLVRLRPQDALAHYNLACSYALLHRTEKSLKTLRRAVELGYRDFRYMCEDHDLAAVRHDPRFRQLLCEYERREG